MAKKELTFKVSSALKSIVGSDLIPDDFIAIFELVKNSYDAHSSRVDVIFEDINSENSKIIIKDNGKGMDYDDIINKWLFLAYSAKKEGTEEDSYDYRKKIKVKRAYAGAKGIGRFSCDKLSSELYLETIKDEHDAKIETLLTDWDKFEGSMKDEFVNISVLHETIKKSNYGLRHGTILEMTELKSNWDREKLLKLKASLAKLINPNKTQDDNFEIFIHSKEEKKEDKNKPYHKKVNGKVENLIFETLDLKTTKIVSKASSPDDKTIITQLFEAGQLVYEIIEENPFEALFNVEMELYYLNRAAKVTFTKRMGIQPIQYGHVFVYKNNIRIYPYGERGADPFMMDVRKTQGYNRFIGNREALGYISILDRNGLINNDLRETTSRGDGLIQTPAYDNLKEWFLISLRRLERFVIDIVNWGNELSEDEYIKLSELEKKEELRKLVDSLTKTKNLISFNLSPDIIKILDEKSGNTVKSKLSKIAKDVKEGNFDPHDLAENLRTELERVDKLKKITKEAQAGEFEKTKENIEISGALEREKKKGSFQGALIGTDKERIISLQHQVFHSSGRIQRNIKLLLKHLGVDSLDKKTKKHISVISKEASNIHSIARFITKANFNLKASKVERDIVEFIEGYINEMYVFEDKIIDLKMRIKVNSNSFEHIKEFRPLEITTLIDIFITNSEKANSSNMNFSFNKKDKGLELVIHDNGYGIQEKYIENIFDLGFTTTKGSGIGLYQAKEIIENEMKGSIEVMTDTKGTTFKILIP